MASHLDDHVGGAAEAVQAEPGGVAGHPQRAVPDQAAAEQRGRFDVGVALGQVEAVAGVGEGELREATVDVAPGEAGVDAEVLATGTAHRAAPAGPGQPRDADSRTDPEHGVRPGRDHRAHHLVPEHHREDTAIELTVDDVEIGAADRAGGHPQQHLVGAGHGDRALLAHQRGGALAEDHRPVGEWSGSLHRLDDAPTDPACNLLP